MMLNTSACFMNGMTRVILKNSISVIPAQAGIHFRWFPDHCLAIWQQSVGSPLSRGRLVSQLRWARSRLPDLSDRNLLEFLPAAVDQCHQAAGNEHRAEHRRHDAKTVYDGEAP